jgi:hypothetical protein
MTGDSERRALACGGIEVTQDFAILDRFDQAQSQHLQGNAERQITGRELSCEVGLHEVAIGQRRIFGDARHDPKLMHAAVACAVGMVFETDLPDRAELFLEHRDGILLAEALGNQAVQGIFRQHRRPLAGIGDQEAA